MWRVLYLTILSGTIVTAVEATEAFGYIFDEEENPLSNIEVRLYSPGIPTDLTDDSGMWSISTSSTGYWTAKAYYNGTLHYIGRKLMQGSSRKYPDKKLPTTSSGVELFGYVKDKEGNGIPDLKVDLFSSEEQVDTVKTNDSGYFKIIDKAPLSDRRYVVQIRKDSTKLALRTYYAWGSSRDCETITVELPTSTHTLRGTVYKGGTSQSLRGVQVEVMSKSPEVLEDDLTDLDGDYMISGLPSSSRYEIRVSKNGYVTKTDYIDDFSDDLSKDLEVWPEANTYDLFPVDIAYILDIAGGTIQVNVSVKNIGKIDRKIPFIIGIYASENKNPSIDGGEKKLGSITTDSAGIPAGDSDVFSSLPLPITSMTSGQSYYIKVEVDENYDWDRDAHDDNVGVSPGCFTYAEAEIEECMLANLKLLGTITGQCSDATFTLDEGGRINDFLYIPDAVTTAHTTGSPYVEWTGPGFKMELGFTSLLRSVFTLPAPTPMTINAATGDINGLRGKTADFGDMFFAHIEEFGLRPYSEGGAIVSHLRFALPLSEQAREHARLYGTDVFSPERSAWTYIDTETSFWPSGFSTDLGISNRSIVGSLEVTAGASIDFDTREIVFRDGAFSFKLLEGLEVESPVTLLELKLVDYFIYDTFDAEAEVPIILEPASQTKIDRLRAGIAGMSDPLKAFELRGGIGIAVGKYEVPGTGLSFTLLDFDADGRIIPPKLEAHLGQGEDDDFRAKLCVLKTPMPGFEFDGFPLFDGELNFYFLELRADGEMEVNLAVPVMPMFAFTGRGSFDIDVKNSYLNTFLRGNMDVPPFWSLLPFVDGEPIVLGSTVAQAEMSDKEKAFRCFAYTTFFGGNGYGVTVPFDGSKPEHGINLNADLISQKNAGDKASSEDILLARDLPNAILRVKWAAGNLNATLTTPGLDTYNAANAAISPTNMGPVFYCKKQGVEPNPNEEGDLVNEICFYLAPPEGADEVAPGTYTINVDDSQLVGMYEIQLWTPNTPPSIKIIEFDPSDPTAVSFQWAASDPDDDADILLFYDRDSKGHNGQLITAFDTGDEAGPLPLSEDSGPSSLVWDTTGLPTGTYYVYARISDGKNLPAFSEYAMGSVTVVQTNAPAPPTNFTAVAGAQGIDCAWTGSVTPDVYYTVFFDENSTDLTGQFENSIVVEGLDNRTIAGLTYGREYRVAISAFIPDSLETSALVGPVSVPFFTSNGNNAPLITSTPITEGRVDYPYEYQVEAIDPDGDALYFELLPREVKDHPELVSPPAGVTIDPDSGLISFTPLDGHLGMNRIEVRVSDPSGAEDTQEFHVSIDNWMSPNTPPVFETIELQSIYVEELFQYQPIAEDPEGNQLVYSLTDAPEGMSIDVNSGEVSWIPSCEQVGDYPSILIEARDYRGQSATQSLVVQVRYRALESTFKVTPETAQPSPCEYLFTVTSDTKYITNFGWDFDDASPEPVGAAIQRHVFSEHYVVTDPNALENKSYSVVLTVTGPDPNGNSTTVSSAPVVVTLNPPKPVVNFTADQWSITSPVPTINFTQTCQWADSFQWTFDYDYDENGEIDSASGSSVSYARYPETAFGEKYAVSLQASGPSGTSELTKYITYTPASGSTYTVIEHPQASGEYWPDWRKALDSDLSVDSLATSFDLNLTRNRLKLSTDQTGDAIAVTDREFQLNDGAVEFSFRVEPSDLLPQFSPEMIAVPTGLFIMGDDSDSEDDNIEHEVFLSAYEIGKFEVTNAQYAEALNWALSMGYIYGDSSMPYEGSPSIYCASGELLMLMDSDPPDNCAIDFNDGHFFVDTYNGYPMDDHPNVALTWYGAASYCNWLSEANGLDSCYDSNWNCDFSKTGFRLPTEAEWERAASWDGFGHWNYAYAYNGIDCSRANYAPGSIPCDPAELEELPKSSPIGWFNGINGSPMTYDSTSPVGCYDMTGNAMEWCNDFYAADYYQTGPATDPQGPLSEMLRVLRGGGWQSEDFGCTTAYRHTAAPESSELESRGMRLAKKGVLVVFVDKDNASGVENGECWATAFTSIQAAVNAASEDSEIWVAEGVYDELRQSFPHPPPYASINTGSLILKEKVELFGGFSGSENTRSQRNWLSHTTVIDGSMSRLGQSAYHVVVGSNNSRLDGFIITGGNTGADNIEERVTCGAGLFNSSSSPIISNCVFLGNSGTGGHGMMNMNGSSPQVTNCFFLGNGLDRITTGGSGGGVANEDSSPTIDRCVFCGNSASGGGAVHSSGISSPIIKNCLIVGNSAENGSGGGLSNIECSVPPTLNCTIVQNWHDRSADNSGAVHTFSGTSKFTNCILWGNLPGQIGTVSGTTDLECCNIEDGSLSGTHVFSTNPAFIGGPSGSVTSLAFDSLSYRWSLTDSGTTFVPGALKGAILWITSAENTRAYFIIDNTANEISIWAKDSFNSQVSVGDIYVVMDYRISESSPCIDAGTPLGAPNNDLEGNYRPTDIPDLDPYGLGQGFDVGAYEFGSYGYEADSYLAWSSNDYIKIDVQSCYVAGSSHATNVKVDRIYDINSTNLLSTSFSGTNKSTLFSLRYEGDTQYSFLVDSETVGSWTDMERSTDHIRLGLGFSNVSATPSSRSFISASLTVPNNPPEWLSSLPPLSLVSGKTKIVCDLDDFVSDDLSANKELVFSVSQGNFVTAYVETHTHELILSAQPDIHFEINEELQITVNDGGGLISSTSFIITVTAAPQRLFTDIVAQADLLKATLGSETAGMANMILNSYTEIISASVYDASILSNEGGGTYGVLPAPRPNALTPVIATGDVDNNSTTDLLLLTESNISLFYGAPHS